MSPFITYNHFNYENVCLLPLYGHNFEDIFDFLKKFRHSTVTLSWYGHIFSHHTDTILCSDHMTHYTASPTVTLSIKKNSVTVCIWSHFFGVTNVRFCTSVSKLENKKHHKFSKYKNMFLSLNVFLFVLIRNQILGGK